VLKGSGSLRYGPSTIGGAINYITKSPPTEPTAAVTLRGGDRGYQSVMLDAGATSGDALGSISLLKSQGDGNRDNSRFDVSDLMVKGGMAVGNDQFVGAKFTYYSNTAQASYLGLSQQEYQENPYQNQAENDWIYIKRASLDLNHEYQLTDNTVWKTLVYWNNAERNWWRQNFSFDGTYNNLLNANGGRLREFRVMGVDTRLEIAHNSFGLRNEADIGVRLHTEAMENQRVDGATATARSGTIREDDLREADAAALFVQNRFYFGNNVTVTPGVRVESYEQRRSIYRWSSADVNETSQTSNTEVVPGIGATWRVNPMATVFGGVHKGFAPPRVQDAIANDGVTTELDAERSTNMELGVRGKGQRLYYEATLFQLDFDNQLITASEAGGSSAQLTNAGETLHQGVELAAGVELGGGFSLDGNVTLVPTAKLNSTRIIDGIDRNGNRLPYAPEQLVNLGLNYKQGPWQSGVLARYVGKQYADFENTEAGSADGKRGALPAYTVWDLNTSYRLSEQTRIFGTVKNLGDEVYIASRAPEGIFTGLRRTVQVGVTTAF
jgi:Fe(3+) dicitrate transport protein